MFEQSPWGAIDPNMMQAPPQLTVYDYPGVKEALGIPVPQLPPMAQQGQPQMPQMAQPWNDLMGAGYGTYL